MLNFCAEVEEGVKVGLALFDVKSCVFDKSAGFLCPGGREGKQSRSVRV